MHLESAEWKESITNDETNEELLRNVFNNYLLQAHLKQLLSYTSSESNV